MPPRAAGGGRYVSAASGLVRTGRPHLRGRRRRARAGGVSRRRATRPGGSSASCPESCRPTPTQRKRDKPDVEALALLPAGPDRPAARCWRSSRARSRTAAAACCGTSTQHGALAGEPRRLDLAALYAALEAEIPDLNIEGATVAGDRLLLFQRGNGRAGVNAVDRARPGAPCCAPCATGRCRPTALIDIRRHDLGEVDGVRLCFSDATALGDARRAVHGRRRGRRGHLPRRALRRRRRRDAAPGRRARLDQAARPAREGRGHRGPPRGHGDGSADGRGPRRSRARPRRCSPRASRL